LDKELKKVYNVLADNERKQQKKIRKKMNEQIRNSAAELVNDDSNENI